MTDAGALKLIQIFRNEGYTAYTVGGCVRDSIMGRQVSDYDIAVPTLPEKSVEILSSYGIRCIETGIKHGTVTALVDGIPYEITTFRTDGTYTDNRRPDSVEFVSDIRDDLSRRDFTVNAMAYNTDVGFVDLFGGMDDIKNKVIRTVGDADTRFKEDALRILRGLRFASVLGFSIEEKTARSITKNAPLLKTIAKERITVEVLKLLSGGSALQVLTEFFSVFCVIIPDFDKISEKHALDFWQSSFSELPQNALIRLAYLCILCTEGENIKKSEILARIFSSFRLTSEQKHIIYTLVMSVDVEISPQRPLLKRLLCRFEKELLSDLILLIQVHKKVYLSDCKEIINDILSKDEAYKISHLDIGGNDVMKLGFSGREVGTVLSDILDLVIEDKLPNDKEKIIQYLKNRFQS